MAGITDPVYRQLCLEQGADLAYTEMVSAKGLSYANEKTRHLIELSPKENTVAVQVFGHEPDIMASEAEWISEQLGEKLALIDVNMGCPARKIVKKGDGASLMREPELAARIVERMKGAVEIPITAKFRRGYHEGEETAPDFAKRLEQAGVDAVTVHGRFATQMYRGASDSACIARVKDSVALPVVGNGDIKDGKGARSMIEETGCDAVMIARASLGNPWVFGDIKGVLDPEGASQKGYNCKKPSIEDRLDMLERHAKMMDASPNSNMKKMRKIAPFYIKGVPGAAHAREALSRCSTFEDFKGVVDSLRERQEP